MSRGVWIGLALTAGAIAAFVAFCVWVDGDDWESPPMWSAVDHELYDLYQIPLGDEAVLMWGEKLHAIVLPKFLVTDTLVEQIALGNRDYVKWYVAMNQWNDRYKMARRSEHVRWMSRDEAAESYARWVAEQWAKTDQWSAAACDTSK